MSVPDPLGRDRLATGAAMYKPPVYGEQPPPPPLYRRKRFVAALAAVAIVGGCVTYRVASRPEDTPQTAALGVIRLFLAEDYGHLRSQLCRADKSQVATNDLETAGRQAGPLLRTFDDAAVDGVANIALVGSYAGVVAKQVGGHLTAKLGQGSAFKVVTIKEAGHWRVCLSPGGYALTAFDLDVPVGGELGLR